MENIVLKAKDGKRYRLGTTLVGPKALAPAIKDEQEALAFLQGVTPEKPRTWMAIWAQIPNKGNAGSNAKAKEDIAALLAKKSLYLFPDIKKVSVPPVQGNTGGVKGGLLAPLLGEARGDVSASDQPPPPADAAFEESAAVSSDAPATVSDTAVEGAAPVDATETKGCPISMVSGEELLALTDTHLPGPVPFAWTRTYRSGHDRDTGLGHGWTHSGGERLLEDDFHLDLRDAEGRHIRFTRPYIHQRSRYLPEGMTLDCLSDKAYLLKQQGQPDKVFTRQGNSATFVLSQLRHAAYQPADTHTAEQGYALNFTYNAKNALIAIVGNWGKSLRLNRDEHGRVIAIDLHNDTQKQHKRVAEYDYSDDGDLLAHRNASGVGEGYRYAHHLLAQRTLVTGFNYYYEWDTNDTSARCTRNWGDDGIYDYHFTWNPAAKTSKATDSRGYTSTFMYNDYGQILKERDNEGGEHTYTYTHGLKTAYTNPLGATTHYFYNEHSQATGMRDPLGHSQISRYFRGKQTAFTDKSGARWQWQYNKHGLTSSITDPVGKETHVDYNADGLVKKVHAVDTGTLTYRWNSSAELIAITDERGLTRHLRYDPWGQVIAVKTSLSRNMSLGEQRYTYTPTGRIATATTADGRVHSYRYNQNDQLIAYSDPRGRLTQFDYDGLSAVTRRTDAEGHTLHYEYDKERNLTALINENGERYRFVYDGNERLVKEVGFDGREQHYKYNAAGQLIKHLDSGEVITEFERDALGNMLTKTSRGVDRSVTADISRYTYDASGRLKEAYNANQYLAFDYDKQGQLSKEHHSDLNANKQRIKSRMVDVRLGYNPQGQRSALFLPKGERIEYGYDAQQQLSHIRLNGEGLTTIERDTLGREHTRIQGSLATHSEYDPMGRLQAQWAEQQTNKAQRPIDRRYRYNEFGNLSHIADGSSETRYVYDLLDRLKRSEGDQPEQFTFDPAGNLLNQGSANGNRLNMQGDRKFSYDKRGNLIQEKRGKEGKIQTEFDYNLQNQLIKVNKDGQRTQYRYDPLGRRIEKQDAFGSTHYLWVGDQLVQESRKQSTKTYIYEPNSFKPVALIDNGETYHYHLDHLGTPQELTNEQGTIVWKARYRTYGNVAVKEVEEIENNLRFQGQYFDEESGLHYNRHRYYNPNTGQFTQQDPIGLLGGVNNYQYAANPIQWIDPLGLKCKEQRIEKARTRQNQMLGDNVGFNVSPTDWDDYPSIGRAGSFVSDKQSVTEVIGNIDGMSKMTIERADAVRFESAFGLEPGSLQNGFKVRQVNNINARNPRSPMEGNRFFLGAGNHLPGGAPEMVVDSIPTVDGGGVSTLVEVMVV